jgi:branched-subunit amino acid ABC-type transport system permease component
VLLIAMRRTRFGRNWRAVADDPKAAALFGVSSRIVYNQTLALSCGLAGLAGTIITLYYGGIGFAGGTGLGIKALVGAIAGGIGSVPGAMLGGLLIGAIEALWSATLPIGNRDIVIYGLLAVLLALKPGGLFGFAGLTPRRV